MCFHRPCQRCGTPATAFKETQILFNGALVVESCMTNHAIIYINWILVIRQHQPISHSLLVFIYIGFVAAFVNCFLRMVDDETRPELKAQDTQLKAQDTPSVW